MEMELNLGRFLARYPMMWAMIVMLRATDADGRIGAKGPWPRRDPRAHVAATFEKRSKRMCGRGTGSRTPGQ